MSDVESVISTQWWVASLGKTLIWARLDLLSEGTARVFDCDGRQVAYDSEDSARAALLDAEFRAYDGLDAEDAEGLGFSLEAVQPPQADSDEALRELMVQQLGKH
ncbi:hypothetical protein [Aquimonas voraii]|uniref:Uncharacterized protein n=1 Tax=Aquimonas voraii TaxID=265719 RepID=A0A1G6SYY9_9GAMM|nr:hypothetical protein [Aquimonas voraii]SDD22018.1 hypothetical protein SAMN04488509_101781 [Aquimonas voraii]